MAETIICAVDDSEAAVRVLDTARGLAAALATDLLVVHAGATQRGWDWAGASVRAQLAEAGELPEVRLVDGSPAEAILKEADREGAEFVVVGSRGRGRLRSGLLGSVSRELASRARCPVVIVPSGAHWTGAGGDVGDVKASVVCGVDGSDQALAAAAFAGRLATRLDCRLVVVHARQNLRAMAAYPGASMSTPPVTGQDDAVERQAAEVVKEAGGMAGVNAEFLVEPGPPTEVLESVADREAARLIVIAARGVGGLRAALLGSVAAELPAAAAQPVVVLSAPAAEATRAGH
ncbi:MAG: universal stress protein [Solirubrobacterales bacterium]|nr:universal stress protein [Solirubrobacterales bacterium]